VTSLYSFRVYFLIFHGKPRFDTHAQAHHGHDAHGDDHGHHGGPPHESPWVVTLPLVLLAIPSVVVGAWLIDPMLFGGFFHNVIHVHEQHPAMEALAHHWTDWVSYAVHGVSTLPFWLVVAGLVVAWVCYLVQPAIPAAIARRCAWLLKIMENKYYVDWFNEQVIARGARCLGQGLWQKGDRGFIDGILIDGSARLVECVARLSRRLQSGYIYHYAFAMIIGVMVLLTFFVLAVP